MQFFSYVHSYGNMYVVIEYWALEHKIQDMQRHCKVNYM